MKNVWMNESLQLHSIFMNSIHIAKYEDLNGEHIEQLNTLLLCYLVREATGV